MANVSVGKMKMLYVMDVLLYETDEKHRVSTTKLIAMLKEHGIYAERKSIYDDIETLKEYGIDIMHDSTEPAGYYVSTRRFELPELKLLVDAVQSSKFITAKKTSALIEKLGTLTNVHQAQKLQKQVYVVKRIKAMNESIYYNVDAIHEAIQTNSKISFEYMKWDLNKELVPKHDMPVISSPWVLTWDDEKYYMLGYDSESGIIKHYRVDKMKSIQPISKKREGYNEFQKLDMNRFASKTFGMFSGKTEKVTLECSDELIGAILDRFGTDVIIVPTGEDKFKVTHEVAVSGHFFGWIVGLGPGARITYPENVVMEFKERLEKMI